MNMLVRIAAPGAEPKNEAQPSRAVAFLLDRPLPEEAEPAPPAPRSLTTLRPRAEASPAEEAAFALLDAGERLAILLSRRSSRLSAYASAWFPRSEPRLAAATTDEPRLRSRRLAALRRYAILYRLDRGGLAFEEEARLAAAGYSEVQAEAVRALVARFELGSAGPASAWTRILAVLGLAAGSTFLIYRWLNAGMDDRAISLVLSIVIATGITSFLAVTAHPAGRGTGSASRSAK